MTFIGREISFRPFFSLPFFPRFYLVGVVKRGLLGCVHNMCLSPRVPEPRGHASGPSTHDICHRLHHVTSIFCKQVSLARLEEQTSLLPLRLPRVSLSPPSLTSASLPLVSLLHICHHLCFIGLKLKRHYEEA